MNPLDVTCPTCWAKPGEKCATEGGATHDARIAHARNRQRDLRPYDVEPLPVPPEHQHDQPPNPNVKGGRLTVPLSAHTRAVGLAGLSRAREVLAQHGHRTGGVSGPALAEQRDYARRAAAAAAAWHEAGCPEPQQLRLDDG